MNARTQSTEKKERILLAKAERAAEGMSDDFSDLTKHAELAFRNLWANEADEVWNDL